MAYNYRRISQLSSTSYANVTSDKMVILTDVVSGPVLQTIPVLNLSQSIQNFINSNPVVSTLIVSPGTPSIFVANSTANYLANAYVTSLSVNSAFLANSSGTITSNANIERLSVNNFINVHTFSNNILVVNNSGTYVNTVYISDGGTPNTYINATSVNSKDMTLTGDLIVAGNVTLSGQTTFVNSSVITTKDKYIIFSNNAATSLAANGSGILIGQYANLTYSDTYTGFQSNVNIVPYSNNINLGDPTRLWNVYANNVNAVSYTVGTAFTANATMTNTVSLVVSTNTATIGTAVYHVANGNMGIGTSTPGYPIDVFKNVNNYTSAIRVYNSNTGSNTFSSLFTTAGLVSTQFSSSTTAGYSGTSSAHPYYLIANNVQSLTIVANNNVGIGNTAPVNKLSVNGTTYLGGAISSAINLTANTLGVYHTGTINAASLTVGSNVVANSTGIFTTGVSIKSSNGFYSVSQFNGTFTDGIVVDYTTTNGRISVGTANSLSFYAGGVGVSLMLTTNTTGVYVPTLVNAASFNIGSSIVANTTTLFIANTIGLNANGSLGGSGQVLTSNGSSIYWSTASGGSGVNTAAQYTFTNTIIFSNTITVANVSANGTTGTSGQYLTSDGTKAYWSTPGAVSVNAAAQYAWTNTQSFSNTITFNGSILANTINATSYTVGSNFIANTLGIYTTGTVNATSHTVGSSFIANTTGVFVYSLINLTNGNGTAGQVLTSNGSSNVYWSSISDTQYTWTNTHTFSNTIFLNAVSANGTLGTAGQVLTSDGTDTYWSTSGGATLTANTTDTAAYYFPMSNSTTGSWSNGVVSNTNLYFVPSTGTLSATIFNSLSDKTQKTNIQTITNSTNIIKSLRGVEFEWLLNGKKSAGVIAQEVESILPHLVDENNNVKSVNYSGLIAYLIETIKHLNSEMDDLKTRISDLEKRS